MTKDTLLSLPPDQRRRALKFELKASLRAPQDSDITEAYLFEKFFGDPTGREYWACWLTEEHEDLGSFVELLAAHNAKANTENRSQQDLIFAYINRAFDRPIYRAVIDAAKRAEAWLYGDTSPLCSGAFEKNDFIRLSLKNKIEVSRQAMVEWLLADPNYQHLVPASAYAALRQNNDLIASRAAILTTAPMVQSKPTVSRPRGPKPVQNERIKVAMREMSRATLQAMKYEEMKATFGAAPSTCEKARKAVLAEILSD